MQNPPAPANTASSGAPNPVLSGTASISASIGTPNKELGPPGGDIGKIEEIVSDVELAPELEQAGVKTFSDSIELPPDVKKMGVVAQGPTQPMTTTATIKLPLSDDQVLVGLHANIMSSLRWMAQWCIRQLKKAHLHLKEVGGKAVRERE